MREFYIRRKGDEEASGPFDTDQIQSLVEADKLDAEAYYYDIDEENWIQICDNAELMESLFPQKKKLSLRLASDAKKPEVEPSEATNPEDGTEPESRAEDSADNTEPSDEADTSSQEVETEEKKTAEEEPKKEEISVELMLAQAEGREDDGRTPAERKALASYLGLRFSTLFLLASIVMMGIIEFELLKTANVPNMAQSPFILIGLFDLVLMLFLLLQVTEVYPLVRLRSAICIGLLSILFLSSGHSLLALCNFGLCISLWFCTATLDTKRIIPFGVLGILSVAGYLVLLLPSVL